MTYYSVTDNGTVVTYAGYGYDLRNRLNAVSSLHGITVYGYNLANYRISEETQPLESGNGIKVEYTYGQGGKLIRTRSYDLFDSTRIYEDISYTYYADGNIKTEQDNVDNITTAYTYDLAGRLLTETAPNESYAYTYLPSGNRASLVHNGVTTTYTYDANNRLLTETESGTVKTYTYDTNGNTLSDGDNTYTYDARNRQITASDGTYSLTYTYNANGLRTSKATVLSQSNYIWVGQNMVCEYTNNAVNGDKYVYGHTLITRNSTEFYIYNGHGDVTVLVSNEDTILQAYEYDAFGVEIDPDENDTNPFRYAGQYYDTETGTYYLRARYYDPAIGRFTQQDNWGYANPKDPLSLNLYIYCHGDPVNYVDYSGREEQAIRESLLALLATLPFVDGPVPVGDIIALIGICIVGGNALFEYLKQAEAHYSKNKQATNTRKLKDLDVKEIKDDPSFVYYLAYIDSKGNLIRFGSSMDHDTALSMLGITAGINFTEDTVDLIERILKSSEAKHKIDKERKSSKWGIHASSQMAAKKLAISTGSYKDPEVHNDGYYGHYHDFSLTIHIWYGDPIKY